jgi:hypothetical protein
MMALVGRYDPLRRWESVNVFRHGRSLSVLTEYVEDSAMSQAVSPHTTDPRTVSSELRTDAARVGEAPPASSRSADPCR